MKIGLQGLVKLGELRPQNLIEEPFGCANHDRVAPLPDNSDRASCHTAGTRRETNGATIDPASRTASQLTDLADQVPPNAPARVPAPLPPRAARRPSPHPQKGPRSSATSRATETRSTSAGSRLSLKNSTSGHIEVNLLGIDIHAIHSPWGQTIAIRRTSVRRNGRLRTLQVK